MWGMQVIASERPIDRAASAAILRAFLVGAILLVGAIFFAYLVFGTGLLTVFTPSGRGSTAQLAVGAIAWTVGLTAPAAYGIVGLIRVGSAVERAAARRPRPTPAVRFGSSMTDDHAVATRVRLPDGSRIVPEIVIGPFGAAVIEELPPAGAVVNRGPRSWDVRLADGKIHMIDNPLERATRDAERVRTWFGGEDSDHVVKVYAAVVGTDPKVQRTPGCAYITAEQVGPWLRSLTVQRSFDADRRERVIRLVRSTL
jgi:hypothetical protein